MKNRLLVILVFIIPVFSNSSCYKSEIPPAPDTSDLFNTCIPYPGTDATLDIVTFNVETLPLDISTGRDNYTRVIMLASLLNTIDADVYALQEVATESGFDQLVKLMPDYKGIYYLTDEGEWNLAYIYKPSEVTVDESATRLLFTDESAYLRPAFEIKITHNPTGISTYIINNHFKCCGDGESLRREEARIMKEYIDNSRSGNPVIVLGDFNDEITGTTSSTNPFLNFINDPDNYRFADMEIAKGSQLWWSYPSYPSHIDHILVTNELFANVDTTIVYKASPCYSDYNDIISDHRPVGIKLSASR
jgi:endonuclease/exonuclease/phosphatase family metal-dependent hydrolase